MRWLGVALVLLVATQSLRAQNAGDTEQLIRQGIDNIYNLEFEKADEIFQGIVQREPQNPAGHFFLAMVQWWRISINIDDEQFDASFFDALDRVIALCDERLEKDPKDVTAIFFKGGAIGFQGRLRFHRNDYLAAANAGRRALPLVQKASELDPGNYDILLGTGIYNYYAEVIPNEYPFVKPLMLFIPSGDREKGLQQLAAASEHGKYANVEATYFLMQIYYYYEKDYGKTLALALSLHQRYPANMVFHKYLGRAYISINNWGMARTVFEEINSRTTANTRGYTKSASREAEYYLGLCDMNDGRYNEAIGHFFRCDELSRSLDRNETSGFWVMATLKAGMVYDLQGRRDLALAQYEKVSDMKEYKDSRQLAERYRSTPYVATR